MCRQCDSHVYFFISLVDTLEGKIIKPAEQDVINKFKDTVLVAWQENAWNDSNCERLLLEKTWKPYVVKQKALVDYNAEFLMTHDNLSTHKMPSILKFMKEETDTFSLFLPPNTTEFLQLIDDNIGKITRSFIYDEYEEYEKNFDWDSNPNGKFV